MFPITVDAVVGMYDDHVEVNVGGVQSRKYVNTQLHLSATARFQKLAEFDKFGGITLAAVFAG